MVVSGFVYRAVEQDKVSPATTDAEIVYGYKGNDLGSESSRERGLYHFVYLVGVWWLPAMDFSASSWNSTSVM